MTVREQIRFWLVGILVFGVAVYVLKGVLLPFVAGMAVAYFLDPAVDRLEAWGLSRTIATTVITAIFFLSLFLVLLLLAPVISQQFTGYLERLPVYLERAREALRPVLEALLAGSGTDVGIKAAITGYGEKLFVWGGEIVSRLWSGGFALANLLSLLFITPVVAFYLLRDWDVIVSKVDSWLPRPHAQMIREILIEVDHVLAGFVRGQSLVCLILAVYYGTALSLAGLEFGLVIGVVSGLISFIPFVGALFGFIAAVGVSAVQFWPDYVPILVISGVFVVGQILEGNFLTPRLVGRKVGLHPVWVIFGLLAGGALFGFVGVLIAVPATAVAGVVTRFFLRRYLTSGYYLGSGSDLDAAGAPAPARSDTGASERET